MSDSEDGGFLDQEAVKSSDGEDGSGTSSGDSEEEEDDGETSNLSSLGYFSCSVPINSVGTFVLINAHVNVYIEYNTDVGQSLVLTHRKSGQLYIEDWCCFVSIFK